MIPAANTNIILAVSWGPMTFGAPLLAWGALACAIPIIIHLVLRQRPRRQVFPAIRFLMASNQASTRTHWIKHLLLMMCRMMLILLVVVTLMKTGCASDQTGVASRWLEPATSPVSAVICLDDSASMSYRFQGQTRLRRACDWARNLLNDPRRLPQGSEVTVITGSAEPKDIIWTHDLNRAGRNLAASRPSGHDRTVSLLLKHAYRMISTAQHQRREVYLFTDLTEQSWRIPPPSVPEELNAIYILDVGQQENRNLSLSWPDLPQRILPADIPLTFPVRMRTGDQPASVSLELTVDGEPRQRQTIDSLEPDSEQEVELTLPAMSRGSHTVTIDMHPQDALSLDNRRFATVSVGDLPNILIASNNIDNETAAIISAMIAPPALPKERRLFVIRHIPVNQFDRSPLDNLLAVLLIDIERIDTEIWERLSQYINQGGSLIIIPGPNFSPPAFKQGELLLPAPIESIVPCPEPIRLAATDLSHPFLNPFKDPGLDSINDRLIFQRLTFGALKPDADIVAPFTDNQPALIDYRVGQGRVIVFAFSPSRQWSEFGTQAAPMLVLMHTILESLRPVPPDMDIYRAGQAVARRIPDCANTSLCVYDISTNTTTTIPTRNCMVQLPTMAPGTYQLATETQADSPLLRYSVNVSETESDAHRINHQIIEATFPPETVLVVNDPELLTDTYFQAKNGIKLMVPLALILLGLIFAESLYANRFYGLRQGTISHK
ncbi:MAG: BatA domain-containing protein [Planctomycetota bacterium]|nr:MAG: BatA domain-containing protein [Planctomycetota bacterium]